MELPHYVSKGPMAEMIGVTRQRVNQLEKAGKLPPPDSTVGFYKTVHPIWRRDKIEKWIKNRVVIASNQNH